MKLISLPYEDGSAVDARWEIDFIGFGECDRGDVVARSGQYLGTWKVDGNEHVSFIPVNQDKAVYTEPFLQSLCDKIQRWLSSVDIEVLSEAGSEGSEASPS